MSNIENILKKLTNDFSEVRQGDVIIRRINALPTKVKLISRDTEPCVIQQSNASSHHHHFAPVEKVKLYELEEAQDTTNTARYIDVSNPEGSTLYHGQNFEVEPFKSGTGEHESITLLPGIYEIDIIREYDYESKSVIRVID